jgi:rod shape-determining protein MreB and related proteins
MINSVLGAISSDMALDFGTSTTRIHVVGRGVSLAEPSAVAIHEPEDGPRRVLAVGRDAWEMIGRAPADIRVVRPFDDGVVADFEVAEALIRSLMVQVQGRRLWVGPRVALCVPYGTSEVQRRALRELAEAAGAREVMLVEHPVAAAIGVELPPDEARGSMVVDVGAGGARVAVLSMGGVVHARSIRVGGDHMDAAVIHYLEQRHGLLVGTRTAEALKVGLGSADQDGAPIELLAKGRDLKTGFPRACALRSDELRYALGESLRLVVDAVITALEHTPPDLAADIAETGLVLTGGVAQLGVLERAIADATGLPVVVPEEPELSVVLGSARMLELPRRIRAAG